MTINKCTGGGGHLVGGALSFVFALVGGHSIFIYSKWEGTQFSCGKYEIIRALWREFFLGSLRSPSSYIICNIDTNIWDTVSHFSSHLSMCWSIDRHNIIICHISTAWNRIPSMLTPFYTIAVQLLGTLINLSCVDKLFIYPCCMSYNFLVHYLILGNGPFLELNKMSDECCT